ncbi:MAG: tetratricopeptide repeat protein [Pirellulaceae bacterium]
MGKGVDFKSLAMSVAIGLKIDTQEIMPVIYALQRLVLFPVEMIRTASATVRDFSHATERQKALVLGIPALIFALIAVVVWLFASMGQKPKLVRRYQDLAEKTKLNFDEKFNVYLAELQNQGKISNAVNSSDMGSTETDSGEDENSPEGIREDLNQIRRDEQLYWLKLLELEPTNQAYRFNYAMAFQYFDESEKIRLLQSMAPEESPGYPDAQLQMALYFTRFAGTQNNNPVIWNKALKHAENCLSINKDEAKAKSVKANALMALNRPDEALLAFQSLYDDDVFSYRNIAFLQNQLGRKEDNESLYLRTERRLRESILKNRGQLNDWRRAWEGLIECLMGRNEIEAARSEIASEIEFVKNFDDAKIRTDELNQLLARILVTEAFRVFQDSQDDMKVDSQDRIIELIRESKQLAPENLDVKRIATNLLLFRKVAPERLVDIYDPFADPSPPAPILEALGSHSLLEKNYGEAVTYLEKARALAANDNNATNTAQILNNLAVAYCLRPDPDPERAKYLANQAMAIARDSTRISDPIFRSQLLHTRATALMALGEFVQAQADFTMALDGRPENEEILNLLIKCCEETGDSAARRNL